MPEPFSLAGRAWIPVASATGQRAFVRLRDLASPHPLNGTPIARLATGRPDCDTALAEFLIGLLAVASGPDGMRAWKSAYFDPPSAEQLDAAFAPFAHALVLDGDGPRFCQDRAELEDKPTPVEELFIDAPADHFLVDRRYEVLSRTGAALALLTLQTMAPPGGAGHRTGGRGGGPLSTFVVPRSNPTLWQFLWANVPFGMKAETAALPLIMPWLAPTRTSNPKDRGVATTPDEGALPAQAFFGMPRRIRLNFETNSEKRRCDLTGEIDDVIVRDYITRPWGTNYPSHAWRHPLSPYYKQKNAPEILPVHLKSSHVGYRNWLGLVTTSGELAFAANIVKAFRDERAKQIAGESRDRIGLLACGYALDKMKPLDFAEAQLPLFATATPKLNIALDATARGMIDAADEAAGQLVRAIRQALYGEKPNVDAGSTVLSAASLRFWSDTEEHFYSVLQRESERLAVADAETDAAPKTEHGTDWLAALRRCALAIFDDTAPIEDSDPERLADVITARKFLSLTFGGYTPTGATIFKALQLPSPDKATGKKPRKPKS